MPIIISLSLVQKDVMRALAMKTFCALGQSQALVGRLTASLPMP
jgi:hypothetical protein